MCPSTPIKLNTGAIIPTVGLGTWKSQPDVVGHAVEVALRNGYRHIDTATLYQNEKGVGVGIKASGIPRDQIFLTTKLDNIDHGDPAKALDVSLQELGTTYVDLWLMHWPAPMTKDSKPDWSIDWLDTWKTMEQLYQAHPDKLRAIGVSNFSVKYLERLLNVAKVVPAVNQIEIHPSCPQQDVVDYCTEKGIVLTAYSPLASDNTPHFTNEVVVKIATKYNVHPANILISLQANKPNMCVIPKSITEKRIISNLNIVDLTDAEMKELDDIDKKQHFRIAPPDWAGYGWLGFPDSKDGMAQM